MKPPLTASLGLPLCDVKVASGLRFWLCSVIHTFAVIWGAVSFMALQSKLKIGTFPAVGEVSCAWQEAQVTGISAVSAATAAQVPCLPRPPCWAECTRIMCKAPGHVLHGSLGLGDRGHWSCVMWAPFTKGCISRDAACSRLTGEAGVHQALSSLGLHSNLNDSQGQPGLGLLPPCCPLQPHRPFPLLRGALVPSAPRRPLSLPARSLLPCYQPQRSPGCRNSPRPGWLQQEAHVSQS